MVELHFGKMILRVRNSDYNIKPHKAWKLNMSKFISFVFIV